MRASSLDSAFGRFQQLYEQRFESVESCGDQSEFVVCSEKLRNTGVAPYILHHGDKTAKTVVLFHGLSDSPYYMRPIADYLYDLGMNVVVPLLPAHGVKNEADAKAAMLDYDLSEHWQNHVSDVMAMAPEFGETVIIGGFSTGGALSVDYSLRNPDHVNGILLFSGALALSGNAESLSKIWGIPRLARWLDRKYVSTYQNPYKYSGVPNSSGIELMEIIKSIRDQLDEGERIRQPVFVAHSEADLTVPIDGVKNLLNYSDGQNTVFYIHDSNQLCHADLVLDKAHASNIKIDKDSVDPRNACAIPKANPLFSKMTNLLDIYFLGL